MTAATSSLRRLLRELAPWATSVALAAGIGVLTLRSAGPVAPWLANLWIKQMLWLALGSVGAAAVAGVPTRWLRQAAFPLFGLLVVASMAASSSSHGYGGVRRWLFIGGLSVQPAELAKLALVVSWAHFAAKLHGGAVRTVRDHVVAGGLLVGTVLPMLLQPYRSAALVAMLVFAALALTLKWRRSILAAGTVATAIALPITWHLGLHTYQRERVLSFLHPDRDPLGAGFQTRELIMTVGSGRLTGQGAGSWAYASSHPLQDVATEFPYAVWSHEQGLLGAGLWLAAHGAVVLLALRASAGARDRFGFTLAYGIAALWLVQVALALGVSLGLLPVMTAPLPLGSYGGSNVVTSLLAAGLVAHVLVQQAPRSGPTRARCAP